MPNEKQYELLSYKGKDKGYHYINEDELPEDEQAIEDILKLKINHSIESSAGQYEIKRIK